MVPFALTLLWINERKLVTFNRVIVQARDEVHIVSSTKPSGMSNYELVHAYGEAENLNDLEDQDFSVRATNAYRLVRTVEMYQWQEHKVEIAGKNGAVEYEYRYSKGWFERSIDSKHFKDHEKQNPAIFWPYKSRTITAQNVSLGEYRLN